MKTSFKYALCKRLQVLLLVLLGLSFHHNYAQAQNKTLVIYTKNGESIKIPVSNIDSIAYVLMDENDVANKPEMPLRILGIGNSWTVNATTFLGPILYSLGVQSEIHVSYGGGVSLESYYNNLTKEDKRFFHYIWTPTTNWDKTDSKNYSIREIVEGKTFDIVTLQQVSYYAGLYNTIPRFLASLKEWVYVQQPELTPTIFYHSTWAYPNGCTESHFSYYNKSSQEMYDAVMNTVNTLISEGRVDKILPSTPAIQQAREMYKDKTFDTPDGTHLYESGQFVAGCVWAETILRTVVNPSRKTNLSILDSQYSIPQFTKEEAYNIKKMAYDVVNNIAEFYPALKNK